jgi:two-component system alkaline phosphatase synthesis response regulator PhoP
MHVKILAVDDEPEQLELVDQILKTEGYTIDTAENGLDALKKIHRFRPDLVLVDAAMPQMSGFTFCETMKNNSATADIPIIMLTGLCSHFGRLNGFAHGANAYLTKPYLPEELLAKINELLPGLAKHACAAG